MKRNHLLSLMVLLLQIVPVASFAEVCIDGIYYNLDSSTKEAAVTYDNNPEVTVNAYRTTYKGNIIIPATIKYDGTTYNVTSIETFAFSGNEELLTIKFPTSITHIGDYAFSNCTKLKSMMIPQSVISIGSDILSNCEAIESITVDKNNKVYDSRNNCNAIIHTETNELIQGCKNTTIPNNITRIADGAFLGMRSLKSIDIPNSVTSIGNSAFSNCNGLTTITIPNSVNNIEPNLFFRCINLKSIILSESLVSIPSNTFENCPDLTSITIPASVESIDLEAFWGCQQLQSLYFKSTTPPQIDTSESMKERMAETYFKGIAIHVPIGYKDVYENDSYWQKFTIIDDIVIPESATNISTIEKTNRITSNIYDITGIRLHAPQKGINIINGKKVVIK